MKKEVWIDILGYENIYKISNLGRVKSLSRKLNTFRGYRITNERIMKPRKDKEGYLLVNLRLENVMTTFKIHRLVAIAFIPNPNNKPEVNHNDGDKTNNEYTNLIWSTSKENCHHKLQHIKSTHKRFKLKANDVIFIRDFYIKNTNVSKQNLANLFNIKKSTLDNLLKNRIWKHV